MFSHQSGKLSCFWWNEIRWKPDLGLIHTENNENLYYFKNIEIWSYHTSQQLVCSFTRYSKFLSDYFKTSWNQFLHIFYNVLPANIRNEFFFMKQNAMEWQVSWSAHTLSKCIFGRDILPDFITYRLPFVHESTLLGHILKSQRFWPSWKHENSIPYMT